MFNPRSFTIKDNNNNNKNNHNNKNKLTEVVASSMRTMAP